MCNGEANSIWDWISEHQTLVVFGGVATFWFVRFMVGHRLTKLRCRLGLHKFGPWDTQHLDDQAKDYLENDPEWNARGTEQIMSTKSATLRTYRYCIDCPKQDRKPLEIELLHESVYSPDEFPTSYHRFRRRQHRS